MKKKAIALTLTAGLVLPTIPVYEPGSLNGLERLFGVNQAQAAAVTAPAEELHNKLQALRNQLNSKVPATVINLYDIKVAELKGNPGANVDLVNEVWSKINAKKGNAAGYDKLTQQNILRLFLEIAAVQNPKNPADEQQLLNDPDLRETVNQLIKLGGLSGGLDDIAASDATAFITKFIDVFNLNAIIQDYLSGKDVSSIKPGLDSILNDNSLAYSRVLKGLGITSDDLLKVAKRFVVKFVPIEKLLKQIQDLRDQLNSKVPQSIIELYHKKLVQIKGNPSANVNLVAEVWSKINAKKGNAAGYDKLTQENILKLFLEIASLEDPKQPIDVLQLLNDQNLRGTVDQLIKLSGSAGGLNDITLNDGIDFTAKFIAVFDLNGIIKDFIAGKDASHLKTGLDSVLNDNSLKFSKVLKDVGITSDDLLAVAKRFVAKLLGTSNHGGGSGGSGSPGGSGEPSTTPPVNETEGIRLGDGNSSKQQTTLDDGTIQVSYTFSKEVLEQALNSVKDHEKKTLILDVSNEKAGIVDIKLPASAWQSAAQTVSNGDILVRFDGISIRIPFSGVNVSALAAELGVDPADLTIKITVKKVVGAFANAIREKLADGRHTLLSGIFDFGITIEGAGKSKDIASFGNIYSTRTIGLPEQPDPNQATGVTFDERSGQLLFVPTFFEGSNAQIRRTGSSVYAVLKGSRTFNDIGSHWAKADIELLASKLIVKGVTDTDFAPEGNVTRSEFASLVVRALGIKEEPFLQKFTDVKEDDWYAGSVLAAYKWGLVSGFEDSSFQPDAPITRQQAAVIIARAVAFAGQHPVGKNYLAKFDDKNKIADWAAESVAQNVEAGIIQGITDTTFAPEEYATRAQAVALIKRFLQYVKFIN